MYYLQNIELWYSNTCMYVGGSEILFETLQSTEANSVPE